MGFQKQTDEPEARLWRLLPPELQERVLACLPIPSLFKFRSVCIRWSSLPSSPHFILLRSSIPLPHSPWLTFASPKIRDSLLLFDFFSSSWRLLPLRFLSHKLFGCFNNSSGGLLLIDLPLSPRPRALARLHVCNPLTNSTVALPPFCSIKFAIARGLVVTDRTEKGYEAIVIGNGNAGLVVEVYHSVSDSWNVLGSLPADFIIKHDQLVEFDGVFYALLLKPNAVLVLSNESLDWQLQTMPVDDPKFWPRLLACQRSLILAGGFEGTHRIENICVWEFVCADRQWKELGTMPCDLCEELFDTSYSNWFECVGVDNFLCFRAHASLKVLIFDMLTNSWSWLPNCPYGFDPMLARAFCLHPQLQP